MIYGNENVDLDKATEQIDFFMRLDALTEYYLPIAIFILLILIIIILLCIYSQLYKLNNKKQN